MRRRNLTRERGQALLIVLAFVAAFLLIVWAALALASGAFLSLNSIGTDTRSTYALDAGLAYAMELEDQKVKGIGCTPDSNRKLTLPYASGAITVTVNVTPIPGCKTPKPSYLVNVTASSTARQLNAQISSSNAAKKATWSVNWEAYQ